MANTKKGLDMNTKKLKQIGDRIIAENASYFTSDLQLHKEKVSEALMGQVKGLPKAQRDFLTLYIESKVDCGIDRVEKKLDTLIEMQANQSAEIAKIKKVVGCNGDG
jgi:hypothetical protein